MPTSPSEHPGPPVADPRRTRVARFACVAALSAAVAGLWLSSAVEPIAQLAGAALWTGVFVVAVVVVARRASRPAADQHMWRWLAVGVGFLGLGAVVEAVQDAAVAVGHPSPLPTGAALLGALVPTVGCMWGSLVHRQTTRTDRGEWLNGAAGLLLTTGAGLLLLSLVAPAAYHAIPAWRLHLSALLAAGLFITVAAVAVMGRYARPLARAALWACGASMLPMVALTDVFGLTGSGLFLLQLVWALPAVLVAGVATLPERPMPAPLPRIRSTWLVLVLIGQSVLLLGIAALTQRLGVFDAHGLPVAPVLYALAGAVAISGRGVRLVRDLASLAENRQLAVTDELTGLGNRRSLLRGLDKLTTQGVTGTALLVSDLDNFKTVNDRFGHLVGDEALRLVAEAMLSAVPGGALVARLGGDEFAVLLAAHDEEAAVLVAREVHAVVVAALAEDHRFTGISISIGVATTVGPSGIADLLRQADVAMYRAKGCDGGIDVYDGEADARARDQALLLADMTTMFVDPARLQAELVLHYQPQLAAATGRVVGVEALVRWQHPTRGMLAPLTFLTLVEENGFMAELSFHVLQRAVREARDWTWGGVPLRISVNLSTSTLVHPLLLGIVEDVMQVNDLQPGRLVLEVTETTLMADPEVALAVTRTLTALGAQLSIDDYGTGYSSLSYLTDLPASEIKLDRAFTQRLLGESRTAAIVAATIALSHRLGLRVVVEGVEDEQTLRLLGQLGADESQGYLHSRPLAPEAFTRWLADRAEEPALVTAQH